MSSLFAVYGAGGCGRGIMPLLRDQMVREGLVHIENVARELVFIDDAPQPSSVNGHRVLTWSGFLGESASVRRVALAVADGTLRQTLADRCTRHDVGFVEVRASNAVVMDDVRLCEGALLSPFVTLTSNIRIGRHFQANLYSYVEHDCVIGDFVTFAPGVKCNGNVVIEDHAYIGTGAIIKQGKPGAPLVIGRGAVVGMGAVVTKSVPPGVTVVGNPARPLEKK
jgi:sugar O-acyltransferase (sialic acid O-acetyltransferase NeuD family)